MKICGALHLYLYTADLQAQREKFEGAALKPSFQRCGISQFVELRQLTPQFTEDQEECLHTAGRLASGPAIAIAFLYAGLAVTRSR